MPSRSPRGLAVIGPSARRAAWRPRRRRIGPLGWTALVGLLGLGAVVVYGAASRGPTPTGGTQVHLPSLGRILRVGGSCSQKAYPPGAMYSFERCIGSTSPIGWPRCGRVTYSVAPAGAPAGYQRDVQAAIAQLVAATGLRLVEVPQKANISIAWDPSLYDPLPGTSGEAGETTYRTAYGLSGTHVTSAAILVSSHLPTGASQGVGEEPILLHELGHAVGLGHFDGAVVMNPLDRDFTRYQPGDLAGLDAIYHPSSCPSG